MSWRLLGHVPDACLIQRIHGPWCAFYHRSQEEEEEQRRQYRLKRAEAEQRQTCTRVRHGVWCRWYYHEPPHSPALVVYKNPSRGFNSSIEKTAPFTVLPQVSETLTEEMEAVNAIYGPGTLHVLAVEDTSTRLRFELPIAEHAVYWLDFSPDYPQSLPTIKQAELDLSRSLDRRLQNIYLIVFSTLQAVFKPGHVCIFDTLETVLPIISCLDGYCIDTDEAYYLTPTLVPSEWKWTSNPFINMSNVSEIVDCVICMEDAYSFKMIRAPCKHYLCLDCFQSKSVPPIKQVHANTSIAGWEVAHQNAEP